MRSWKHSTDPLFEEKATRVLALYRACAADGVVVCFDEFGPISLQAAAAPACHLRAQGGVGYFFGAYDFHADVLIGGYRLAKTRTKSWRSTSTSVGAIVSIYASTRSTTNSCSTGQARSACGPNRTTSS
jgi:hypothetical protein